MVTVTPPTVYVLAMFTVQVDVVQGDETTSVPLIDMRILLSGGMGMWVASAAGAITIFRRQHALMNHRVRTFLSMEILLPHDCEPRMQTQIELLMNCR
jgi:hypothetical protein